MQLTEATQQLVGTVERGAQPTREGVGAQVEAVETGTERPRAVRELPQATRELLGARDARGEAVGQLADAGVELLGARPGGAQVGRDGRGPVIGIRDARGEASRAIPGGRDSRAEGLCAGLDLAHARAEAGRAILGGGHARGHALGTDGHEVGLKEALLMGKTAHAAEPWNAVSPFAAAQRITDYVLSLNQRDVLRDDFCVATLIEFRVGSQAYGVAAGDGVLRFTIRTREDAHLQQIISEIESKAKAEAACENLQCEIRWLEYFAASNNAEKAVNVIKECADNLDFTYQEKPIPFFWGEDFGLFTQHYTGALFGLGSGTSQPPLHHPDFDFPDEIVETGAKIFYNLAKAINR